MSYKNMTDEDYKDEGEKWDTYVSELNTGTKPNRYALATRETLLGLAGQRDRYKEALEEIVASDGLEFMINTNGDCTGERENINVIKTIDKEAMK